MTGTELLIRFLHNTGYVLGTGAALVFNLLNYQIENHAPELAPHKQTIFKWPMRFMWAGLIAMVLVHTIEVALNTSLLHILKALTIYVVLIGGLYNVTKLAPKVQELAPDGPEDKPDEGFVEAKDRLQKLGLVLLVFWILDFILNTYSPPAHHFADKAHHAAAILLPALPF